jgi:hypothetical protein
MAKNLDEIKTDGALTLYGAALAAAYLFTSFFLIAHDHYLKTVSKQVEPVCWPYFESCYRYRLWSNLDVRIALLFFGMATLVPFFAFLKKKVKLGYFSLAAVALAHLALIFQDFRNTQNQYYMLMWVVFAYLFWPRKRASLHLLVISFYFWAGRLKLNWQWLSGHNLYEKLWLIPRRFNSVACIYVVFLEMLMIWGLLSRNRIWFWATLAQLVLFHFMSISQIGTYYPALMLAILAIYPFSRRVCAPYLPPPKGAWLAPEFVLMGAFAFFQVYPSLASWMASGNRVLDGVGRTFALNMFEGIYECKVRWIEHYKDGKSVLVDVKVQDTERIQCEPIYYYSKTLNRCRQGATDPKFSDLDFYMEIGVKDEIPVTPVIRQRSFCSLTPSFNLFLPNSWIHSGK